MKKILKIIVLVIVIGIIGFLGIHYFFSGELPLQLCTNCHGT
jgi:hypothetical protein